MFYPISSSLASTYCSSLMLKTTIISNRLHWKTPLSITKSLRKAFFLDHLRWLLLDIYMFSKFALFNFFHSSLRRCFLVKVPVHQ